MNWLLFIAIIILTGYIQRKTAESEMKFSLRSINMDEYMLCC